MSDRTVFVTGSTRGIGFAIAEHCLAEGAKVIVNGRSEEGVFRAVDRLSISESADRITGAVGDVSEPTDLEGLIDRIGEVDVLINNAGVFDVGTFEALSDEEWTRYFAVNVMSGVRLARSLLPQMLRRNRGRIIFIGTESAIDVPADMIHYGATKAAALAVANGLAKLTRGTEVTVNTVLGGPTYSDGVSDTIEQLAKDQSMKPEDLRQHLVRGSSLLSRFIEPGEIDSLVTYLASPASSAINGAALRADGGVLPTLL